MRRFRFVGDPSKYCVEGFDPPFKLDDIYEGSLKDPQCLSTVEEYADCLNDEDWQEVFKPELKPEIEKLQAFKDYVHKRLDDAGIPKEPNGEHSKHGCRIGDRLDLILKTLHKDTDLGYFAGLAMQGILANPNTARQIFLSFGEVDAKQANKVASKTAIEIAKELIKQLDEQGHA